MKDVERVNFFFQTVQRQMPLSTRAGEDTYSLSGVAVRRLRPVYDLFWGNASVRPANSRYYQWGPSGLLNLTMIFGADVFGSPPHFTGCDATLLDGVRGLNPNPAKHDFILGVEPNTGIVVEEQGTLQVSARIHAVNVSGLPGGWFPALGNRVVYVPVAWFDQHSTATPEALQGVTQIYTGQKVKVGAYWTGLSLSAVSIVLLIALGVIRCVSATHH